MDAEIVVELFSRVKALERDVAELKQKISDMNGTSIPPQKYPVYQMRGGQMDSAPLAPERKRDTTRYVFDGGAYSKKGLVYAIVTQYVAEHPDISCSDLKHVFDKSLQGSIGVVEKVEIAKLRGDEEYRRRFFADKNEILHLVDGDMVVCTQWGILNIPRFLMVAKRLGYQIEAIS